MGRRVAQLAMEPNMIEHLRFSSEFLLLEVKAPSVFSSYTAISTRKVLQRISAQHMLLLNSEKCYRVSELKLHSCLFYLI